MILRAAFFIGLVYLLAPHEPDLGLGRPGTGAWLPSTASVLSATGLSQPGRLCVSCAGRLDQTWRMPRVPIDLSAFHGRGLSDIKAEIDAAIRARRAAEDAG
jgi:hypothetical protein